jgi:selenide,water dikinase
MNAEAVSALALCVLPYGPEQMMEEELVQMLAGALKMLSAANCSLVGGHTSEGAEAALGFSVTGVVHPQRALVKGPLPRGATLILTKALGELQHLALMSGMAYHL